ncbi:helix-turn-helix domain-containing protein [Salipaludibacillus sp. CF4.18]|uniref:helix-turn-helix domain-containing protein n=1 Tax=Salipaludibacillus sp. CF4.18 TaxID=3373081 RepID=UPI003EE424F9
MEESNIISTAMQIHHITNLNVYIIDYRNNSVFYHEEITIPSFMPGSKQEDISHFHKNVDWGINQLYTYANEWGLHYLCNTFRTDQTYAVIIGPFMELTPNIFSLSREYKLANNDSEYLKNLCHKIQVLSIEKVNSYSRILQEFEKLIGGEFTPINIAPDKNIHRNSIEGNSQLDHDSNEFINMRYKIENDLLHAVEQGDKSKALDLLHSNEMLFSFTERLPNAPLRRIKNLAIILNTLLRSAVRKSNVPTIFIHRVSEKFAFKIEETSQLSKLQELHHNMIEEYSDLVTSSSHSNYSRITKSVIEYIVSYYDKKIDKNKLSELCFTHPSHLSRKFKQETNMTITAYQQKIRLNRAKHLLKHEPIPIEEIAWIIGYEDSSYFTRVFKKETGYTPSQFKESMNI